MNPPIKYKTKKKTKNKKQRYKLVKLLIPTLCKTISYHILLAILEGANHEQSLQKH